MNRRFGFLVVALVAAGIVAVNAAFFSTHAADHAQGVQRARQGCPGAFQRRDSRGEHVVSGGKRVVWTQDRKAAGGNRR